MTTRTFLRKNKDVVRAYLKAYAEGVRRYKADRAFAMEVLKKYTKVADPELLEQTHALTSALLEESLYLEPKAIQAVLDFSTHPRAKTAKPEDFTDLRILRDLEQSGFFRTLR